MNYEKLHDDLIETNNELQKTLSAVQAENRRLISEMAKLRQKAKDRIIIMKSEVRQEISSVKMILTAIKEGQSSHWQKKENIRLALEILGTIPTFDRGDFFNYEDDF